MDNFISTADAAAALGVSTRRVQAMIKSERLVATRIGRDWLINPSALDAVRDRRPGRPAAPPQKPRRKRKV